MDDQEGMFDLQIVQSSLMRLLQVSSPEEAVELLLQSPELRGEQAQGLLVSLIDQAQSQGRVEFVKIFRGLQQLIQDVREGGQ